MESDMNFWTIGSAAVMAAAMMGCSVHSQAPIKQVAYDFSDSQHYGRSHASSPAYGDHAVDPEDSYEYQESECEAESCKRTAPSRDHSVRGPVGDQYFIEPQPAAPAPATLVAPAVVRSAPAAETEALAAEPAAPPRAASPAPIARRAASYDDEDEYGYGPAAQRAERLEVYEHHESQRITKRVTYGAPAYPGHYGYRPVRPVHRLPPPGVAVVPVPKGGIFIPLNPQAPFILTPPSRLADR
jgi:hypothetical protein